MEAVPLRGKSKSYPVLNDDVCRHIVQVDYAAGMVQKTLF
jgi:hypothetical protein